MKHILGIMMVVPGNWFIRKVEVRISLGALAWVTYKKPIPLNLVSLRRWLSMEKGKK